MNKIRWFSLVLALVLAVSGLCVLPVEATPGPIPIYTWNQTGTASWIVATNWTPTRTTPATNDILQFNGGGAVTATDVPAETIGQLLLSNNTTVNLQAGAANTLTISGDVGVDLDVPGGSSLNMNGANALTILLAAGATGSISGSMTCSTAVSKLNANDAGAITFNSGAVFTQATGCSGNVFTNAGTYNVIVFASGSTFVSQTGSNPFGYSAPFSKVTFQAGSLFRHEQTGAPSFSGRTYANFELNSALYNSSSTGGSGTSIDNLTITAGTLNLNLASTTNPLNVKGNISVASSASLVFNSGSANTLNLIGITQQTISGTGTLTIGPFEAVVISNPAGVVLGRNVTFGGSLTVNAGSELDAGTNSLTVTGALTNNGQLKQTQTVTGASDFSFFGTGGYGGLTLNANSSDLGNTVVTIRGNQDCDTNNTSVRRCFVITPLNNTGLNATATFYFASGELNAEDCATMDVYRWTGSAWQLAGTTGTRQCTTSPYSLQVTGISNFSPFALSSGGFGPTNITLSNLTARSSTYSAVGLLAFIFGLLALGCGLLVWKRKHA